MLQILGQVDRKFIVSNLNGRSVLTGKSSEFLVLFDQHAVDERIRLENNLSGNTKRLFSHHASILRSLLQINLFIKLYSLYGRW